MYTSDLLEKFALIFLHNFHCERSLLKLLIKKVSLKINVKNIKIEFRKYWQRNKETQQTLRVIVSIQYDASY